MAVFLSKFDHQNDTVMKPVIYLFILFFGITTYSFAQNKKAVIKEDPSRDLVLSTFMKAQACNDVAILRKLISGDAVILIPAKSEQKRISKADYIAFLKESGRVEQACHPSYEIITATANTVTARIDFDYPDFMVQNLVKAEKRTDSWVVTELSKSFAPKPQQDAEPLIVMQ